MKANCTSDRNSRGKFSKAKHTQTIIKNNGIAKDANEKITKTIIHHKYY